VVTPLQAAGMVMELITRRGERPLLVALDGPSAAGTTTLAGALAPLLGASVVHGDDFYRDMPDDQRRALTSVEGVQWYFDWQRLRREALEPLKAGTPAGFRPYSWRPEGGLADEVVTIAPSDVLIVEGVYAARPELADLADVAVLVDTAAPERMRRLVARGHGNEEWWPRWDAAEMYYFTAIRPRDSFDLVVPGA
jgi:uridine kinase